MEDTIGQLLGIWRDVEIAKQERRLVETQYQAAAQMIPARYQNPQALAASATADPAGGVTGWAKQNPLLALGGLALVGWVLWRVLK